MQEESENIRLDSTEIESHGEDDDEVASAAIKLADFFQGDILAIDENDFGAKLHTDVKMLSYRTYNSAFSHRTFDILDIWYRDYFNNPLLIGESEYYDDFVKYVQIPFIELCMLVSE